jgi:hypothetical protein
VDRASEQYRYYSVKKSQFLLITKTINNTDIAQHRGTKKERKNRKIKRENKEGEKDT